jgi:Dimerisation domain
METASEEVTSMIFMSKWSSQTLCAGAELGLFDFLSRDRMRTATDVAAETGLDPALLYRLLRALASIGLLNEMPGRGSARAMGARHGLGLRVVTRHGSGGASPYRPKRVPSYQKAVTAPGAPLCTKCYTSRG